MYETPTVIYKAIRKYNVNIVLDTHTEIFLTENIESESDEDLFYFYFILSSGGGGGGR